MQSTTALLGIVGAITVGAMSPGPSFVMVARTAVAASRTAGLFAALGMGVGGLVLAIAALLGLHSLLLAVPSAYVTLKVLGGVYLVYLGLRMWRSSNRALVVAPSETAAASGACRAFATALITQLSNPKAAVVYASVFAAFLPANTSLAFDAAVATAAFTVESAWYAVVALALSSETPRSAYLRYKTWVDRAAGSVMLALGTRLMLSAHHA